jgi:hypothetical protein
MGIIKSKEANGYPQKGRKWMGIIKREEVNGYHQKGRSEWVSSKGKEVNGYHRKGSKWMGIIKREGSEWVSSKVGLVRTNPIQFYTYKLHWSNLLQLRVNKTFRSFSVVFFWGSKYVIDLLLTMFLAALVGVGWGVGLGELFTTALPASKVTGAY